MPRKQHINEIIYSFIKFRKGLVKDGGGDKAKLPYAQGEALFCVFHNNDTTVSNLAQLLSVTPGAATQLAESLVKSGYLEREGDATDRRITRLKLSSKGIETVNKSKEMKIKKLNKILAPLTDKEVETLASLLKKVSHSMQEIGEKE